MVIGQFILALPIVTGLTMAAVKSLDERVYKTISAMGADTLQGLKMFIHEARYGIMAAVIAGFSRVFAEIGISMMLGGNIKGYTRNITTAIALETGRGEFAAGIALGIILLIVAFIINILFTYFQKRAS
jgi:tungstate transport system permease protein